MLKKSYRLTTKELENVLKKGAVYHSPNLTIRVVTDQKDIKFAVALSQKVFKTSVKRHVAKRHIYDLVSQIFSRTKKGSWAVIFVKETSFAVNPDAGKEIESIFRKAHILI